MPADTFEILEGDEEGLRRFNGWGPVEILRREDGLVEGVELRRCLRVYDENRRFAPVFDDAERKVVGCDTVLPAVGQATSLGFLEDGGQDIEMMRPGWPKVDSQTLETTAAGVFVAGDLAHGTRLLIDAVASGKAAARSIYRHITGRRLVAETVTSHRLLEGYRRERGYESTRRQAVPVRSPVERIGQPELLVEIGYSPERAVREASRRLDCGVTPVFDGSRCVLCGGCVDVCPTRCLNLRAIKWPTSRPRRNKGSRRFSRPAPAPRWWATSRSTIRALGTPRAAGSSSIAKSRSSSRPGRICPFTASRSTRPSTSRT